MTSGTESTNASIPRLIEAAADAIMSGKNSMTPEAQRIAIAEACPNLFIHIPSPFGPGGLRWKTGKDDNGNTISPGVHVDLLHDLNAMHEAEKVLDREQIHKFLDEIEHLVIRDQKFIPTVSWLNWLSIHSTASQRAEAFLRALGLWKD